MPVERRAVSHVSERNDHQIVSAMALRIIPVMYDLYTFGQQGACDIEIFDATVDYYQLSVWNEPVQQQSASWVQPTADNRRASNPPPRQ